MKVMRQRARGKRMLAHGPGWLLVELVIARIYRFAAGQVVLRSPGRYDSRWASWAPAVPEEIRLSRAEGIPRSTWARRPGWHRQIVRALAVAWLWCLAAAPTFAAAAATIAIAVATARGVERAHRRRKYGDIVAPWWEYVAAKIGHDSQTDPLRWVRFPNRTWSWEPVEPVARLVAEDSWLARRAPGLAEVLRRLATPIAERGWVTAWRAAGDVDGASPGARLLGWTASALVYLVERTRTVRVVPRVKINDLDSDDARIEVHYPARYPGHSEDVAAISAIVCPRLPGEWEVVNRNRQLMLEFRHPTRMPSSVLLTSADLAHSEALNPRIGKDANGWVTVPLKAKTPHVSIAASTGWGKTTTANVLAAQLLGHGWRGVILDPKRVGFVGAFRNAGPNIEIRTTLEGQIEAIAQVREEMNRRYEFIENYIERVDELGMTPMRESPEEYFEPVFLLEDEKGSLTVAIKSWWKREGGGFKDDGTPIPGKGDPEPLIWMQEILWRGRQAAIHVITLAQQNNLNVFLNTDMRDQYMFRILSGPQTQSSWVMTFPGTRRKKISAKKGRAIYGIGPGETHDVQLAAITDAEARKCAEVGIKVSEAANAARAERLGKVLAMPPGAVSPRPLWVDGPAKIHSDVPGQASRRDTPAPSATRPLTLVTNAADKTAGSGAVDPDGEVAAHHANTQSSVDLDGSESDVEDSISGSADGPDLVVGTAAAARFLGIKEDTFKQRRKRMDGVIPGETVVGRAKAWPRIELLEWNNLYGDAEKRAG